MVQVELPYINENRKTPLCQSLASRCAKSRVSRKPTPRCTSVSTAGKIRSGTQDRYSNEDDEDNEAGSLTAPNVTGETNRWMDDTLSTRPLLTGQENPTLQHGMPTPRREAESSSTLSLGPHVPTVDDSPTHALLVPQETTSALPLPSPSNYRVLPRYQIKTPRSDDSDGQPPSPLANPISIHATSTKATPTIRQAAAKTIPFAGSSSGFEGLECYPPIWPIAHSCFPQGNDDHYSVYSISTTPGAVFASSVNSSFSSDLSSSSLDNFGQESGHMDVGIQHHQVQDEGTDPRLHYPTMVSSTFPDFPFKPSSQCGPCGIRDASTKPEYITDALARYF